MEDAALIPFSSLAELEQACRGAGPGNAVTLQFVGSDCTVVEAAGMYRLLQEGLWEVEKASNDFLRSATRHFDQIEALETCMELLHHNITVTMAPVTRLGFDNIRSAANAVIISAHKSHSLTLLDEIVIEAQRVGRVCRGLMFGADDVAVAELQAEDLDWLMAGGHGGMPPANLDSAELHGVLAGGHAETSSPTKLLAYSDRGELLPDDNRFAVLAALGDDVGEANPGAGGPLPLAGLVDDVGDAPAGVAGKVAEKLDGDGGKEGRIVDLVELKEETVVALLQQKIRYLLEAIARAKERVIVP